MRITADTTVLVRVVISDDDAQRAAATAALARADLIAVPTAALCEMVWVLSRSYRKSSADIAAVIREIVTASSVRVDVPAVQAGLTSLDAGGDFADGVIAFEGARLGGLIFVSFDHKAARIRRGQGGNAEVLTTT